MALLEVQDLHAGYGRAEVLTGVNLKLEAGQVVTVIGPNGAGKSTMLNALMGVLPCRARVSFDGRLVSLLPTASALVILVAGLLMTVHALPRVG